MPQGKRIQIKTIHGSDTSEYVEGGTLDVPDTKNMRNGHDGIRQ